MMPKDEQPPLIDEVMAEVYRIKAELVQKFDGDMAAMARDARAREGESGHPVVSRVKTDGLRTETVAECEPLS